VQITLDGLTSSVVVQRAVDDHWTIVSDLSMLVLA
jgi:hypothetical protein